MLAGHALIQEHQVTDAGVSAGTADKPLEADLPKTRVDLGSGAARACKEAVPALAHLCQGLERRIRDPLARIAQRPVDVDEDGVGICGRVLAARGDLGVSHGTILSQCENTPSRAEHVPQTTNHARGR